jgi:endonuclease VIII
MRVEDNVTLHTHFKMEGEWHLYRHGRRFRGPGHQVRVILETEEWVAVGFRLGIVELVPTSKEEDVVGHLGPDLLGPDWDADVALKNLTADGERPISDVLLDQRVMAGLGNIYKSELCFLSGLDPWTPVAAVPDPAGFVERAKRVIEANRTTGMQITTGENRPGRRHWVYGRGGEACRRCGTPISRRVDIGERVTYWCPSCQPQVIT